MSQRIHCSEAVKPARILEPHRRQTARRIDEHSLVLVVQDTTKLDFRDHPLRDARCLDHENRFGRYPHLQLAITPQRSTTSSRGGFCT